MLHAHGLTLYQPADLDEVSSPCAVHMRRIAAWAVEFLASPHEQLGRHGAVCPFARPSMDTHNFLLACAGDRDDISAIEAIVDQYRRWFIELLEQTVEKHSRLLTFLVLLPAFDRTDPGALDALHARLKDAFVNEHLMVGQFHPSCDQPGLWNNEFRPLRAPVPLLAIRQMVASDLPFLMETPQHLSAYLHRFAPAIPNHIRRLLVATITNPPDRRRDAAQQHPIGVIEE